MSTTYSAIATVTGQVLATQISSNLEALIPEPVGVGVFEVEDGSGLWEVAAYFTESPDIAALGVLEVLHNISPFVVSEIPEQDWVAKVKRDLPPVEAGRFFVYGSHDADKVPEARVALLIEAAMAFGTGHHGTTRGCLIGFDNLLQAGVVPKTVIDVGCGTAVLAMAAAKVLEAEVWASDIDPVAVEVAQANVAANGLSGDVQCVLAAGLDSAELSQAQPFDLVFANILKGPLIALASDLFAGMSTGGHAILSGILAEQADEVRAHYTQIGFKFVEQIDIVEWSTIVFQK